MSALFIGFLVAAELWRRLGNPPAEWTRKLVHLGGGVSCILFPFLVESPWIVLALALTLTALFALAARFGALRSLHGVERSSRGAEYYPLAIFLVLLLAGERTWLYVAAVLVLAVADAFAALVGSRYGTVSYGVEDGARKTLEGSFFFFLVAFLAMHLPMLLMSDLPRPVCVLAAALVALLVTGFEAISLRGADNLFVPLAVVVILGKLSAKPLSEVTFQAISLLAICIGIGLLVRKLPYFNVGGTIAVVLYAYATWSLGSWHWALPVFTGLFVYLAMWSTVPHSAMRPPRIRVRRIARALLAPFLVLVLANATDSYRLLFGAYLGVSAAVLALGLIDPLFRLPRLSRGRQGRAVLEAAIVASATTLLPVWLVQRDVAWSAPLVIAGLVLAATWACARFERGADGATAGDWTATRFALGLLVGGVVLALERWALTTPWNPV